MTKKDKTDNMVADTKNRFDEDEVFETENEVYELIYEIIGRWSVEQLTGKVYPPPSPQKKIN